MLFSSVPFLFYFLPAALLIYFAAPRQLKNAVLLLASLFFYAWGEPKYMLLMLVSIVQGYGFGLLIEKHRGQKASKVFLTLSILVSLGLLGYFKYADFFLSSVNAVTGLSLPLLKLSLPIGIGWAIEHVGWAIFGLYVGSLDKESAAANAIVQVFMNLVFMPGLAISIATTTLVGQYMGANNVKSAEKSANYSIMICIGFLLIIGIATYLCRYLIAEGFSDDPIVIKICADLFIFGVLYQLFDGLGVPSMGALRGAGDTKFPMILMFLCMWVLMIPLIFFLGDYLGYGVYGAWLSTCITCICVGIGGFWRFKRGHWKQLKVAASSAQAEE